MLKFESSRCFKAELKEEVSVDAPDVSAPISDHISWFPGFGSFVEKTVMPYISTTPARLLNPCSGHNCTSPFSYKNVLKLTKNGDEFNQLVSQQQISGNLDSPEGGFDAIMQVAVCEVSLSALLFRRKAFSGASALTASVFVLITEADWLEERHPSAGVLH